MLIVINFHFLMINVLKIDSFTASERRKKSSAESLFRSPANCCACQKWIYISFHASFSHPSNYWVYGSSPLVHDQGQMMTLCSSSSKSEFVSWEQSGSAHRAPLTCGVSSAQQTAHSSSTSTLDPALFATKEIESVISLEAVLLSWCIELVSSL